MCIAIFCFLGFEEASRFGDMTTAQKMKFSIKDLVTFIEEILNGKLHFLYSGDIQNKRR